MYLSFLVLTSMTVNLLLPLIQRLGQLVKLTGQFLPNRHINAPLSNPFHLATTRSVMTAVSSSVTTLPTPTLSRLGISKQNFTPTRVIRKFPGPAGCLPPLVSNYDDRE